MSTNTNNNNKGSFSDDFKNGNNSVSVASMGGATVGLLQAVSLYSPLITMISILIFSVFSAALNKGLFYIATVFFITAIRILFVSSFAPNYDIETPGSVCKNGKIMPFTGKTYSTFVMMYTLCYFVTPMFILTKSNDENMVNYYVIAFFVSYIIFDIMMRSSLSMGCIDFGVGLVGDLLVGLLFGVGISLLLFYADKISLLFINELNSNKEVCSVPSKQTFRCSVFKDGMIIGSSVSA
jgi:hypothetical protein